MWASASHKQEKRNDVDYEFLKIKSYKHWNLYLHENQCYLGRTFVQLKEEDGMDDFLSIEGEVRDEFFLIGEEVKSALNTLFQPDKMNYAALSNTSLVIHVHIIPRYKESREFAGALKIQDGGRTTLPMTNLMSPTNPSFFKFGMPFETHYNREERNAG
ncbi:MAG TPA: hypothetical protein VLE95_06770 [Chlamydiales bacterium]|nr:hypothetical protein [Chlamydiales bacterium]